MFCACQSFGRLIHREPYLAILLRKTLVTAHPAGGCPIDEDGSHGVVDHFGKLFRDDTQAVHDGLYVSDGSIIRSALEVNPFLTISALTERIVENIVALLTH